jgi:GNAT superfamily N-acetyltransferase
MTQIQFARASDEDSLRRCQSVIAAAHDADYEYLPADPFDDVAPALTGKVNGEPMEYWLGVEDDGPVAAFTVRYSDRDNTDLAFLQVYVHPAHRSRGLGRGTATAAIDRVRTLDRTRVSYDIPLRTRERDPSAGVSLAESIGAKSLLTERRRTLRLASISDDRLTELDAIVGDSTAGYTLVTWRNHTPEPALEEMAGLIALMSTDPPLGDLDIEAEIWNAERYEEWETSVRARNRDRLIAAARHDSSGQLVGFTDLTIPNGRSIGYQWATIVRSDHRGHRLGLALKIANLRYLRAARPDVTILNTWNAVENSHMVAVNEALGFEVMEDWAQYGLDV